VGENAGYIEKTMTDQVFSALDHTVKDSLSAITLQQLADSANANNATGYMYYL
jgi:hypothetical protein